MGKRMKRLGTAAVCLLLAAGSPTTVRAEEGYTYNYSYWGEVQASPDAYRVSQVVTSSALGLDVNLKTPEGLFVSGDRIWLCDTGNSRILEIQAEDSGTLSLVRSIDSFHGPDKDEAFAAPTDVAVGEDGCLYVCDRDGQRIVKLDGEGNLLQEFTKPKDANFDQDLAFQPEKLAVDSAGRVYCVAVNVNKGLIKFEADGSFSGFVGAAKVTYDLADYLWKKIATSAQRGQMESFVPTEYDNLYMDEDGFIYTCTGNVTAADLDSGAADAVRRLNMMGNDILVRNGEWPVLGDLEWEEGGGYKGPSLMQDITAMENDIYAALDRVRGRLFVYDDQGRLLFAFGGNGSLDGHFKEPSALEHMGRNLLVLDALAGSLTVFTPTEYGTLIFDAMDQFQAGDYARSGETWEQVLELNGNYDLAYIGIGRALMRQGQYGEAMEYFRLKWDDENYSRAFKQYRKEWVEDHIFLIFGAAAVVLCVPLAAGKLRGIRREIDTAEIFQK